MSLDCEAKEVVITGMGVATPLDQGSGVQRFWEELCNGTNAVKPIKRFNVEGHKCRVGAEIFDFEPFLDDYWKEGHSRCVQFFALASQQALRDASVVKSSMKSMGIAVGTILGDIPSGEQYMHEHFFLHREKDNHLLKQSCLHTVADSVAKKFSLQGPVISINTACCSGADAVRNAAAQIRNGRADIMLAGGVDVLSEFVFRGFSALNALTTDGKVRPFDKRRTGLALGEGAGAVVLEEKNRARKRGAKMYCALAAAGSSADAYNMVKPHNEGDGLWRAINSALSRTKGDIGAVDYICAHGTGTPYNDIMETKAIKRVFGKKAYAIKISSIKSMIGHTLGASSAIETITCVKAIEHNVVPPTINFQESDPECDLQYVMNAACKQDINICISLSAGFGGQNTALVFKRI